MFWVCRNERSEIGDRGGIILSLLTCLVISLVKPINIQNIKAVSLRPFVVQAEESNGRVNTVGASYQEEVYWGDSYFSNLPDMLDSLQVPLTKEDKVVAFPDPGLGLGSIIKIKRAMPAILIDAGMKSEYRTWSITAGEFLKEKNIVLGKNDIVSPPKETMITNNLSIRITRVIESEITIKTVLAHGSALKKDAKLLKGTKKLAQIGKDGLRVRVYRVRKENGVEVKRILVKDNVAVKSVDEITNIGTKIKPKTKPRVKGIRTKITSSHRGTLRQMINTAARKYGVSASKLYRLMMCESGGNRYSVGGGGRYFGLFQYSWSSWQRSGFGRYSIYDAWAQINAAASQWGSHHSMWPACTSGM